MLLAARLAALAREGAVLASALVRELVANDPDVRMGEAREVSLPGARRPDDRPRCPPRERRPVLRLPVEITGALMPGVVSKVAANTRRYWSTRRSA